MSVDLILLNGNFHDAQGLKSKATAIAARGGRIVYVGDDDGARALPLERGAEGPVDLKGACVLPGLTDSHLHFCDLSISLKQVVAETPSLEGALDRVAEKAASIAPGEWVLGYGWNQNAWGGIFPTGADLDRVAPNNPVCLQDKSGHAVWANSRAMALAGITAGSADPGDGKIIRDSDGRPLGIMLEGATAIMFRTIPQLKLEDVAAAMIEGMAIANRYGLTGVHDLDGPISLAAHQLLRARGGQTLRVVKSIPLDRLDQAIALGIRSGFGDDMLRIGPVKMFSDGAMGPRTAWMLSGYEGSPDDTGICVTPTEVLRDAVMRANAAGLSCAIHAIGDRANREMLDVYEAAGSGYCLAMPNRIEHAQILDARDMRRFAELGVIASMQPIHATSEIGFTDRQLGKRSAGAYAFKSLLRQGAVVAFGSDCPVETMDPMVGIHAAVTRRRAGGEPGLDGWHGDERLTVAEAVEAYSLGAAKAAGWSDRLGTLQIGKLADMTILDRDIYAIDPMEILEAEVMGTVVGGRFVWRDGRL